MTQEERYRQQAVFFIKELNKARMLFANHKPSIGYVGEELLRLALRDLLPKEYDVCQGFVLNNEIKQKDNISRQCDIIVFRKGKQSIAYSIGELNVINAHSVVAVIEVKSSLNRDSFLTTLEAFEKLQELRVIQKFVFVFGKLSKRSLRRWFFQYRYPKNSNEEVLVMDTALYDWSDMEWLPESILSLESHNLFVLDHLQDDDNDFIGYTSYKIKDKTNMEISCLQEFLANVMDLINSTFEIDRNAYSIKDGFPLYRF
jgi:hypothetical protein